MDDTGSAFRRDFSSPSPRPAPSRERETRVVDRLQRALSRISIRLLAFNLLLVFLPVAGLLTLDTYEKELLRAQEQAMVQQGRLLAAALSGPEGIDPWRADGILMDLRQRHQARLRVVDASGKLLADSSRLGPQREPEPGSADSRARVPDGWLYRVGALPFRIYRRLFEPPQPAPDAAEFYSTRDSMLGPEVQAALRGRYGAATRISGGQRSVTLYAAIPIRYGRQVIGAALVSQSTYSILQALYAVRLDTFKVLLAAVAVAAVLSLLVSTTIARPLRRLRAEALALVDGRGRLQGAFRGSPTHDEIGDLTRALESLTARLRDHMSFVEQFASDVSHEFKNPLASIRTAVEVLPSADDPEQRRRFLQIIQREVARLERLLAGVREISRIDARLDDDEPRPVDLPRLLESLVDGYRWRARDGVSLAFERPDAGLTVRAVPDRLTQVFENLLDNALSFSPPGGTVRVAIGVNGRGAVVTVADDGPGIPPEHLDKIFARFFSYRPGKPNINGHAGLGLPIAKAIVEGYGGTIDAANRSEGGSAFVVRLPAA